MKRYWMFSALSLVVIQPSAQAEEFDAKTCIELAKKEAWEAPDRLCTCLAEKAEESETLDAELVELQSTPPEDRQYSEEAAAAIAQCAKAE